MKKTQGTPGAGGFYPQSALPAGVTKSHGAIIHADTFGTDLTMRSKAPPSAEEYEDWLKSRNQRRYTDVHRPERNGVRLRRAVIMRRQGATWKECAEATGVSKSWLADTLAMAPPRLRP